MEQERIDRFEDLMEGDQGDPEVQYQLGLCYLRGDGTQADPTQAEAWLRRAADQGHPEALALLKDTPQPGQSLSPVREENLADWCERADDGDAEAQYQVARYLAESGGVGAGSDVDEYLSAAVKQGHPQACLLLAQRCWDTDPERAAELLGNAADCAMPEAMEMLGSCYVLGRGVAADLAKAEELFLREAEIGGPEEKLRMAIRYATGDGAPHSVVKTNAWLKKAMDAGMPDAKEQLASALEANRLAQQKAQEVETARQKAQEEAQQAKLERHRQEGLAREAACKQEEQLRQAQKEQAAREQAEAEAKARREREARILAEEHTAQAERRRKYGRICMVTMLLAPAGAALSAAFTWLEALLGGRLWLLRLLLELLALAASLIGCCGPELAWSAAANLKGLKTAQKALPSLLAAAALIVTFRVTGEGATAYIVAALLNGLLFRKFCKG